MVSKKFTWEPDQWRFRAEEARTLADQMTHEQARTIMRRLPTTMIVSLSLPRNNSPFRKEELDEKLTTSVEFCERRCASITSRSRSM